MEPISIAHWIMGDGYWVGETLKICTDNFTKEEILLLIDILNRKFDIKARINKRTGDNGNIYWRIRISKSSMSKLISITSPFIIPEMIYKLGLSKDNIGKK
jgi:hypothetical protein